MRARLQPGLCCSACAALVVNGSTQHALCAALCCAGCVLGPGRDCGGADQRRIHPALHHGSHRQRGAPQVRGVGCGRMPARSCLQQRPSAPMRACTHSCCLLTWLCCPAACCLLVSRAPCATPRSFNYLPYPPGTGQGGFRGDAARWPGGGADDFLQRVTTEILPLLQQRYNAAQVCSMTWQAAFSCSAGCDVSTWRACTGPADTSTCVCLFLIK